MIILLFFAFVSGLITIFAPCIWPLLPIILSSTTSGGKSKPLGITVGIMLSFALFTLTISYIVKIIPFDPEVLRYVAVFIIGFLGLTLIIPKLTQILESYVSRFSGSFGKNMSSQGNGFRGGFVTGFSLGIVWTPCAGPILATIATLAATRAVNFQILLVTIAYVVGVGIPLFLFATAGRIFFTRSRFVSKYTGRIQQVFGVIMILTAISIFTNYDKVLQAKLLDIFPSYATFITDLESNDAVKNELDELKGKKKNQQKKDLNMKFPSSDTLPNYGAAPEFTGVNKWLNTEKELTLSELKGKVVLVDFWTYTCINCIRTLPHVTSWYEKYKDQGFVIVGVHTPEFEFEKKTENVQEAIKQYNITYPVAQDNDFETWNAYNNRYWPAHYLIDAQGNVREIHEGEGNYEETEKAIQQLLKEAGKNVTETKQEIPDETPTNSTSRTHETYLGSARAERFGSKESLTEGTKKYSTFETLPLHYFSYSGIWNVQKEYSASTKNSALDIRFEGNKVFLVIHPKSKEDVIKIYLDDKPLSDDNAGKDVKDATIRVTEPKLYELIDMKGEKGNHILRLEFMNEGTEVYAFTFG
jgi:cytochrome c biogenesis protein CcdA/thiol-disulfide isomerase/thioredoxin